MLEHLSEKDLERYVDRTLAADELLRVDEHLSHCADCRTRVADRSNIYPMDAFIAEVLTAGDEDDQHLTYDQLASYVDGKLDPVAREIADVHKKVCELCSLELTDLQKLKDTLPLSAPSRAMKPSLWEQSKAAAWLRWAVPVFAAILLGIVAWVFLLSPRNRPVENVAMMPTPVITPNDSNSTASNDQQIALSPGANLSNSQKPPYQPAISLADGSSHIELDEAGNLRGLNAGAFEARIKSVLTGGDIHISPDAIKMRSAAGVLMGGGDSGIPFKLTTPVGKVIESDRPQFKWSTVAGAESYVVTIYDDNFNKVASSPSLKAVAWTSSKSLKRGVVYNWQVTAIKEGREIKSPVRPAPDAKFKVVDGSSSNEIAAAKRQTGNSHLLLGILYANAGMIDEAKRDFQALVNQNPKSEIARRLLNKVKAAH